MAELKKHFQHTADTVPVKPFAMPVLTVSQSDTAKKKDVRLVNFHYECISWNL
jgi:hypothetical protein